jgi:hypothetical protein
MKVAKKEKIVKVKIAKMAVSETNIKKAAARLLSASLVSTEIAYIQHVLGVTATQAQVDEHVVAVRKMPWSSIVLPE